MAETSYLWDNPGTGDSPAPGYGNALLSQVIFRMITNGTGNQGVLRHWLDELEVTDPVVVDTVDVECGAAMLYGVWYESDAVVNVNINAFRGGNCLIVVRASWAAQTARIVARAVGALTQNPGVTYEIPLANVAINGAGVVTLITDTRDFCEFTTDLWPFSVETDNIQADAVTTAKLINQTRWLSRGAGCLEPDTANPCTWTSNVTSNPYNDYWAFADAVVNSGWLTFRVPADFTGANIDIYLVDHATGVNGDVRWGYSAWVAAAAGVLANAAAASTQPSVIGDRPYPYVTQCVSVWSLCALAVNAGDIVHMEIYRDGAHAADTLLVNVHLMLVECRYTADS